MKANIEERKKPALFLTVTNTKESVEAFAKATNHCNKFLVRGGRHCNHNNAMKPSEIEANNRDVKMMK